MKRVVYPFQMLACMLLLLAVACAPNPADNASEAKVEEPAAQEGREMAMETETVAGYLIDQEASSIEWVGSKVTGSHDGGFNQFEGTVEVVNGTPEGTTVDVTIDNTSLWSDNEDLTGHLKSADFFDVENFPTSTFTSTKVVPSDTAGEYEVTGNLTLHGVTKQITFPATIEVSEDQVTAQAEFFIKRFDFGIEYPGRQDDLIRDEVVIKLNIVATGGGEGEMVIEEDDMEGDSMETDSMDEEGTADHG
ncbi:MAG: YceI family protein [Acidobacteriota bacterium]|nr:YceI family protein [Acidobacteriota bacterium]